MRKSPREEAERWLAQAAVDLRWVDHLVNEGGWHIACFLAQQVTEKAIKAFLYNQGEEVVLGHSVERLCSAAERFDPRFAEQAKRWVLFGQLLCGDPLSQWFAGRHSGRRVHARGSRRRACSGA